ncbi:hypothetical protein FSP39_003806 [Pinctada imbricata]|uniref:TM2 domain-containing protein n=1 Tax=Pinctada imbricata TaxID=66713 RepID=A0AA88XXZ2_PINIB|nr:hypothetical protein FSP39_003806 [Pinctada imbricata]
MSKQSKSFGALSFPKPSLNGFIRNVEKQLDKFHHDEARSIRTTYLYAVFLGMFGAHHFYLGRHMFGFMYMFTFGLCGIGYVADLFRIRSMVKEANMRIHGEETRRSLFEAYLLWFPFGIFGFHYIYLKDYMMAILYVLSGGVYGIAWFFDAVRIPNLVASFNGETYLEHDPISLVHAYLFSLPPFGILGFHHYYCGRKYWGLFYTFTLAGLGFGWLMDFLRMPFLVSRAEDKINGKSQVTYHKDDVYMLWLPLGLIGAHHFYLRRYRWGLIYLVTFGGLGIGWIADLFRIPSIVNEINSQLEQEMEISDVIGMADKRIFSVPAGRDHESVLPFDDVIHNHHSNSSPRVLPKITRDFVNGSCAYISFKYILNILFLLIKYKIYFSAIFFFLQNTAVLQILRKFKTKVKESRFTTSTCCNVKL